MLLSILHNTTIMMPLYKEAEWKHLIVAGSNALNRS
jgi:hypothetical protein